MTEVLTVSVVVVNYNGARHLNHLLDHLAHQTRIDFDLYVVDNGSTDNSLALLSEKASGLPFNTYIIENNSNLGFGPATNQGIRASSAPWIATLNNDTRPEPDWLERILEATTSMNRVGMVGSKLLRDQDPTQIDSAGIAMDWMGIAWDWRGGEDDDPGESTIQEIFGPCAGAALYSRTMLTEVGLFDDNFFAYLEDVDLAWRARLAGWQAVLQPSARALHAHSATLGDASPLKRFLLARNKVWLLAKNYPCMDLICHLPGILLYDTAATLYGMYTWRDSVSLRGRLAGVAGILPFLRQRRQSFSQWHDMVNWRDAVSPNVAPWQVSDRYAHLEQKPVTNKAR